MKVKFSRIKNNLIFQTGKFLSFYKIYLLVFFIIFLIGFITGIMTCSHYASSITYENLINSYLMSLLTKDSTYLSFFLKLLVWFIIIAIFITTFTKNKLIIVINTIILLLMSYIYGFDLCVIILSFGLAGIVFGILILGLLGIVLFFVLILIVSIATKRFLLNKKTCDPLPNFFYIKLYVMLIAIASLILFILSLLFSIIHIFIIVDWFIRLFLFFVVN